MPEIKITVAQKIATNTTPGEVIVCGNSDYTVTFDLDAEWATEPNRTARFVYYKNGLQLFQEKTFTGNTAPVPVLSGIDYVMVGVYAGDLRTTTPAKVLCDRSILCGDAVEQITPDEKAGLQAQIGDLSQLQTADKSSLVAAINEAAKSGGSGSGSGGLLTIETITIGEDSGGGETVAVTGLSLDLTSYSAKVGDGFYINPVVSPTNATNRAVSWESSNTAAATVNSVGYVECIAAGDTVITCTTEDGGYTATCAVSVAAAEGGGDTEVTLSSISATYSGGDVAVGTAVTDLTGIVVTAHYSDGSTATVTDYTLSGTIAEGSNTVSVSYGGKTTTFAVTGVAESTDTKVQLSTLERTSGMMGPSGSVVSVGGTYHVTVPYSAGMFISTGMNASFNQAQYPIVVVFDEGEYTLPSMTQTDKSVGSVGGKYPAQFTCTLSGYTENAIVYVSMLIGTATNEAMDTKDIFYYIPGGEA